MNRGPLTANHARFLDHLAASGDAVIAAAEWLMRRGHAVTIAGMRFAPRREQWRGFVDGGDLFLQRRVEVKRLSRNFTGSHDWPFGSNFIVCARHAWDAAEPKPSWFLIFSHDLRAVAVVSGASRPSWRVTPITDSRYEGPEARQDFYLCPLERVEFFHVRPETE